jgi:hypothetical protein
MVKLTYTDIQVYEFSVRFVYCTVYMYSKLYIPSLNVRVCKLLLIHNRDEMSTYLNP